MRLLVGWFAITIAICQLTGPVGACLYGAAIFGYVVYVVAKRIGRPSAGGKQDTAGLDRAPTYDPREAASFRREHEAEEAQDAQRRYGAGLRINPMVYG